MLDSVRGSPQTALTELLAAPQGMRRACTGHHCAESPSLAWALGSTGQNRRLPAGASTAPLHWVGTVGTLDLGPNAGRSALGTLPSSPWNAERQEGEEAQSMSRLHVGPHLEKGRCSVCERELRGPEPPGFLQNQHKSTQKERCFSPPEQQSGEPCATPGRGRLTVEALSHRDSAPCGRTHLIAAELGDMPASTVTLGGNALA